MCMPGCPAVLAWLHLQVWSNKCTQIHVLVFISQGQNNPCSTATFKARSQELLPIQMANTRQDQYSRWRHGATFQGQWTLYHALHVFLHMCKKAFNFELWLFKKCKGSIGMINFHVSCYNAQRLLGRAWMSHTLVSSTAEFLWYM